MTDKYLDRTLSRRLLSAVVFLLVLPGCEPEPVAETFAWEGFEIGGQVIAPATTADCRLPTLANLEEQLGRVASQADQGVVVNVSEPLVLTDETLGWAVALHLEGLWTMNLDPSGSTSLARGMPPARPESLEDYEGIWKDLREAGVCGFAVVDWEFPTARVETVAWLIDYTTFHESITDSTIVVEPAPISGLRTDGRCASARWIGGSLGTDLEVGSSMSFLVRFGLCGDYLDPKSPAGAEDEVLRWPLVCDEALPTIESYVPLGRFECGEVETLVHPQCCGARLTCTLTIGVGGFEYSVTQTPTAIACPPRPFDAPLQDDCETEW